MIRPLALVVAATVMLSSIAAGPAWSRMWKATPQAVSQDYATINDNRGGGELVLLMWLVPGILPANGPGAEIGAAVLKKYVVLLVAHGQLEKATGTISFQEINELQALPPGGKPLAIVAREDLPPAPAAMLVAMEGVFRQSLGALGKGSRLFIFDAGGVDYCKEGRLSVPFANETYTWDTPFPGCQSN